MIARGTGRMAEDLYVLGHAMTPSYLLDGPRPLLFDAGFSWLGSLYARDAAAILGGRKPRGLCLTHSHFDHCGAAAALQEAFPGMEIAASPEAASVLARPRVLERMGQLTAEASSLLGPLGLGALPAAPFRPFTVNRLLTEGDGLDLGGGLTLQVLATPGHTRDFLSYYVPERRLLVASEAAGCADPRGYIRADFLSDYGAYLASLRRLRELEVDVLCQGHYCVYVGSDAREFLERSVETTEVFRSWVEELLEEEGGDMVRVAARVRAEEYDPLPEPRQSEGAYLVNLDARIRRVLEVSAAPLNQPQRP